MALLWDLLELPIAAFAAWTLAYHVALLLALPARRVWLVFAVLLPAVLAVATRGREPARRRVDGFVGACLLLAAAAGLVPFVSSVPNLDDLSFVHRALVQLHHLHRPFLLVDTVHDAAGIPALSMLHCLTAYEPLTTMTAHALGLDPLWTYQHVGAFVAASLLTVTLVLLATELGASRRLALAEAAAALAFLALDGNLPRAFGSVAFARFWQGKCILWSTLLPATLLLVHRFLRAPTPRHLAMVVLAGVCAVGLSGSGTVLFPGLVLCAALADAVAGRPCLRRLGTAALASVGAIYPCAIGLAFSAGVIAQPDMSTWSQWEPIWWRNVYGYVVGDVPTLVRDGVLMLLPACALRGHARRFLLLLPLAVGAVFLNPATGPTVLRVVTPANYWRLAYLIPLPLSAGLIAACFGPAGGGRGWRAACGVIALLAIGWAFQKSALLRSPFAPTAGHELPAPELAFARIALPHLAPGDRVLAPETVVLTLALLEPRLRFVAGRSIETPGLFRTAGRADEGIRRTMAQAAVTTGTITSEARAGLQEALARGLGAVVTPTALEGTVTAMVADAGGHATAAARDARYTLLLLPRRAERRYH